MQQQTIRRLLLAGAFTAAGIAGAVAWDSATSEAHAADKKPAAVAEQPGGLLGKPLPEQASDRAKQVHGQVAPGKPDKPKPTKTKPSGKPEPPKAEPAPEPEPERPEPPADDKPAKPEPAKPPPAPAPDPIVITLPADDPAPLPDADALPVLPQPAAPVPAPAVITPAPLPVLTAPVPAEQPPTGVVDQLITSLTAAEPDQPADCADDLDAVHINRDALRALLSVHDQEPAATAGHDRPAKPCPGQPVDPHADCATSIATNTGHGTGASPIADLTDSTIHPVLARLQHARPRSTIPAGRHTAIEPGPA